MTNIITDLRPFRHTKPYDENMIVEIRPPRRGEPSSDIEIPKNLSIPVMLIIEDLGRSSRWFEARPNEREFRNRISTMTPDEHCGSGGELA